MGTLRIYPSNLTRVDGSVHDLFAVLACHKTLLRNDFAKIDHERNQTSKIE
jgi:hypothetical protein